MILSKRSNSTTLSVLFGIFALVAVFSSCSSAYYGAMEKIGIHKRDLLVSRVKSARDSQKDAQQEFKTALEQFKELTHFQGGDLEATYEKLKSRLDASEAKAAAVHERIESVDNVANALFSEWKGELAQYSSDSLRDASKQELSDTKERYNQLISAMRHAEAKIPPVLRPLKDQVLFLKHNLNAKAIGSLNTELVQVQDDVDSLLRELQRSIDEADIFIKQIDR